MILYVWASGFLALKQNCKIAVTDRHKKQTDGSKHTKAQAKKEVSQ
jgi:hypothetical protein